jgi:hypothetical protein
MQISILQGTTPVYVETQAPVTNANGLISIEIGSGNVISGSMSNINWASGSYFIKTEADIDGSGIYTITGISELLSVPYALHAKTVENITNTNITNWNTAFGWGNHAGLYKPIGYTPDGSETKVNAGTNITVTGVGTTANPYVINSTSSAGPTHYIGELYQGGVIFYLDNTGTHGLIVAMIDLSSSAKWSTLLTTVPGALSEWDGINNTVAIAASTTTICAADLCDTYTNVDYGTGVYSDWYLPSLTELSYLTHNLYPITKALESDGNGITTILNTRYNYWTSTEYNLSNAFTYSLVQGGGNVAKNSSGAYVRAIRSF